MKMLRGTFLRTIAAVLTCVSGGAQTRRKAMNLGSFSISLSVKDIVASQAFYEKLGLAVIDGKQERRWLILRNGDAKIGLFQGMFEGNMLTFNAPDARSVQRALKDGGVTLLKEAEGNSGPAHVVVKDPDGNTILIDQI